MLSVTRCCLSATVCHLCSTEYWRWQVYKAWYHLAKEQEKDSDYYAEAARDFEEARRTGGACAAYAAIRHYLRFLRESECDAA